MSSFNILYWAWCLKSCYFYCVNDWLDFCSDELLELYDSSLLLLVLSPYFTRRKFLLWMYWHLSPYLQKPYSKKLWQSLVLYLKLNVFFSLISSSLWAKAHWSKRKNYKFVEWTKSPLIPISTHLSIKN